MPAQATPEQAVPSLTKQAVWLLTAKVIGFGMSLFAPLIIVRMLSQADFGVYKQVYLVLSTGLLLLTFGFHMNLFYFLPRRPAEKPKIVLNVLVVHATMGFAGMAVLLGYPHLLDHLGSAALSQYTPYVAVALFLTIAGSSIEVVATANQEVKYSSTFIVATQLTKALAIMVAALSFRTISSVLWATILQTAVQCAVLVWYVQYRFPGFVSRPDWRLMREQVSYSLPLSIGMFMLLAQTSYHQFLVARRVSAAEYAIYAVGCSNLPLIGLLRESVNSVMIPRMSLLHQRGDRDGMVRLAASSIRKLGFFYLPVVAYLSFLAAEFIAALYTPRYLASRSIFLINIAAVPLLILPLDAMYRAYTELARYQLVVRVFVTGLLLGTVYLGIQLFGMVGAIAAVIANMYVDRLTLVVRLARVLKIGRRDLPLFKDTGKIALASLLAGLLADVVRSLFAGGRPILVLACTGTVFCALYCTLVLVMGVPTPDETAMFRRNVFRVRRLLKSS